MFFCERDLRATKMLDIRGSAWVGLSFLSGTLSAHPATFLATALGFLSEKKLKWPWRRVGTSAEPSLSEEPQDDRYQAQKMEALGRLTGGIAHDFNNLLTVILGNATALRVGAEARGDSQAVQRAEMIERAAERGGRLASQLLAFSRKQMLRPETVSVYPVISAMIDLLTQAAGEPVRIRLHTDRGLWKCRVDVGQLESAILNLVLNARDAMPDGGNIVIACGNHRETGSPSGAGNRGTGDYVRIDVKDTGHGIPSDIRKKVFEPFFTTKSFGQGSGLGLSQVHGFAGQSGGWVELESAVGVGTTMSLFLPREKSHDADPPASLGRGVTVVVLEPDPDILGRACETLRHAGYHALMAADASTALAHLVSGQRVHLLVTERDLPGGISGIELARSARQVHPGLRVLVASKAAQGDARQFDFLTKPYRAADLINVVGAVLTSDTFSVETEQLLADARAVAARGVRLPVEQGLSDLHPEPGMRDGTIRLGVMPFRVFKGDTDTPFAAGLAEEITTALSRFRSITCVASASIGSLADEPVGETQQWRKLDLDFLVQGSLRARGSEIRVILRLINMRGSGEMSWGQRFDSPLPDLLNLQDRIAQEIAAQVVPELVIWEGQESSIRPQVDPTAYHLMLQAIPAVYRLDEAGFREAGARLEQALALDPSSASCHSWLAHWYLFLVGQGWAADPTQAVQRAEWLSQQAIILDPGDARGFTIAGHVRAFLHKDAQAALWLHERAIALNPSLAMAWCYSGLAHSYLGRHAEAIHRIQTAQQLSPFDPHGFFYEMALGMPYLLTGQYEQAVRVGRRSRDLNPGFSSSYKGLVAALGHLGEIREAAVLLKQLMALEPNFSICTAVERSPLLRSEDLQRYAEGLRLAGVPETEQVGARIRGKRTVPF